MRNLAVLWLLTILWSFVMFANIPNHKNIVSSIWKSPIDFFPTYLEFSNESELLPDQLTYFLNSHFELSVEIEFHFTGSQNDEFGFTHHRFTQSYHGFQVECAQLIAHEKNGKFVSVGGKIYHPGNAPVSPSITQQDALAKALNHIQAEKYLWETQPEFKPDGELVFAPINFNFKNPKWRLAWKFDVFASQPMSRDWVYIDAKTTEVIATLSQIHYNDTVGIAETKYSGTRNITTEPFQGLFRLRESGRKVETYDLNHGQNSQNATDFGDADNVWDNVNAQQDEVAGDAHWGAEMVYDYFLTQHNRNSYNNNGAFIRSYVHYGLNFPNAFWNGINMSFGDGDPNDLIAYPLTTLEIIGHEFTHAVTQHTAGLIYIDESGGLNESFSDIFGVVIEFWGKPQQASYIIGEEVTVYGQGIRDMANPKAHEKPDTYLGEFWQDGGVHDLSGVQNHWFYLLSEGGAGINDTGSHYSVVGIGRDKAADIAYRTLTVYLTQSSQYADARFFSIQAAKDLYGNCSEEVKQTTNAWYAVGVGGFDSSSVQAGFTMSNTDFCSLPAVVDLTDLSINANQYIWNFSDGSIALNNPANHTFTQAGTYTITQTVINNLFVLDSANCFILPDTSTYQITISVTDTNAPLPPPCRPATTAYCCGFGIHNLTLANIQNDSPDGSAGYEDFTCQQATTLVHNAPTPVEITTNANTAEDVRIWIDLNNDGIFHSQLERVFTSENEIRTHSGDLLTPAQWTVLNTPLRLRVASDHFSLPGPSPCIDATRGQFEDYTVVMVANTNAPVADFTASNNITCPGRVYFTDLSVNVATSWQWSFGDGSVSSLQHPSHIYQSEGLFDVTLIACNAFGCDTISKPQFVRSVPEIFTDSILPIAARLNWDLIAGSAGYKVKGRRVGSNGWVNLQINSPTQTWLFVNNLASSTAYEWQVKPICGGGLQTLNNWSRLDTFTTTCPTPHSLWETEISLSGATLNWSPSTGPHHFQLAGKPSVTNAWQTWTVPGNDSSFNLTSLGAGKSFDWAIRTFCDSLGSPGWVSAWSPVSTFITLALPSFSKHVKPISQPKNSEKHWQIFPNPAEGKFIVHKTNQSKFNGLIMISDLKGRIMKSFKLNGSLRETTFNIADLKPGIYLVKVSTANEHAVFKLAVK